MGVWTLWWKKKINVCKHRVEWILLFQTYKMFRNYCRSFLFLNQEKSKPVKNSWKILKKKKNFDSCPCSGCQLWTDWTLSKMCLFLSVDIKNYIFLEIFKVEYQYFNQGWRVSCPVSYIPVSWEGSTVKPVYKDHPRDKICDLTAGGSYGQVQ